MDSEAEAGAGDCNYVVAPEAPDGRVPVVGRNAVARFRSAVDLQCGSAAIGLAAATDFDLAACTGAPAAVVATGSVDHIGSAEPNCTAAFAAVAANSGFRRSPIAGRLDAVAVAVAVAEAVATGFGERYGWARSTYRIDAAVVAFAGTAAEVQDGLFESDSFAAAPAAIGSVLPDGRLRWRCNCC